MPSSRRGRKNTNRSGELAGNLRALLFTARIAAARSEGNLLLAQQAVHKTIGTPHLSRDRPTGLARHVALFNAVCDFGALLTSHPHALAQFLGHGISFNVQTNCLLHFRARFDHVYWTKVPPRPLQRASAASQAN